MIEWSNNPGVYIIENNLNNRFYIGSANNIKRRWKEHKSDLRSNKHKNIFLQNDWNKCGEQAYSFSVIEVTSKSEQSLVEQEWIDRLFDNELCYNLSKNALNPMAGRHHNKETIEKIRASNIGKIRSVETRKAIGDASRGRITSEETKKKISAAGKGRIVSAETRQKTSQSNRAAKTRNSYLLRSPTGEEVYVENIMVWCKQQGFPPRCMYRMLSGKYPKKHITCHGYSLIKLMPPGAKKI